MHPDLTFAVAKTHQHEMRRHAQAARRAAELDSPSKLGAIKFSLPRIEFGHRVSALRARIVSA